MGKGIFNNLIFLSLSFCLTLTIFSSFSSKKTYTKKQIDYGNRNLTDCNNKYSENSSRSNIWNPKNKADFIYPHLRDTIQESHNEIYLSDISWFHETNGSKAVSQINKSITGASIQIEGISYSKGLGTHAPSRIKFQLDGKYDNFASLIGVDDEAGNKGSVEFQVWGDNILLYQSPVIHGGEPVKEINADITGIKVLELVVTDAGNGSLGDYANWANARVSKRHVFGTWKSIGNYVAHFRNGNQIDFITSHTKVRIELCKADIIRIRLAKPGEEFLSDKSHSIIRFEWPKVNALLKEEENYIYIKTDVLELRIFKSPFSIAFYDDKGQLITKQKPDFGFGWDRNRTVARFILDAAGERESFYGGGLHFHRFNLRGEDVRIYSSYTQDKNDRGYQEVAIPLVLSTSGYGLLLHNSYDNYFRMGSEVNGQYSIEATNGEMDLYFFRGEKLKDLVSAYCELTGFKHMPPKKALGMTYRGMGFAAGGYGRPDNNWNSQQYLDYMEEFRRRQIPVDIIGTEPGWSTIKGNLSWSPERFSNPAMWVKNMISKGLLPNNWMYGKVFDIDSALYDSLKPFMGTQDYFDVTSEQALDIYFDFSKKHHFDLGVLGYKEDSHGNKIKSNFSWPSGVKGDEMHNLYWFLWSRALFERYHKTYNQRFFLYITTTYTGGQRYALCSYADFGQNVAGMVRALSNTGWTGVSYAPELQYYYTPDDRLKFIKSHIMSFSPFPVHNEWRGGFFPWEFGEEIYSSYLKYLKLHYRLIPYIYSNFWEQHNTGIGLIRPLPMEFQTDKMTYDIGTQYMFGEYLMVAPVVNKENGYLKRDIYLPKGASWIDYYTGEKYHGGTLLKDVQPGLGKLPLFVRIGAIIPMMPEMNYVGEKPIDLLTFDIYPDTYSSFTLYEDDGISFDYEKGIYCETKYEVVSSANNIHLTVNKRNGTFIPESRNYLFKINSSKMPKSIELKKDEKTLILLKYNSLSELKNKEYGWVCIERIIYVKTKDDGKKNAIHIRN